MPTTERDISGLSQPQLWCRTHASSEYCQTHRSSDCEWFTVLPVEDGVEWKRVSDLREGDEVKDWTTVIGIEIDIRTCGIRFDNDKRWPRLWWPSNAYVPVKVKAKKWRRVITQVTTNEHLAKTWNQGGTASYYDSTLNGDTQNEYSEVEEL